MEWLKGFFIPLIEIVFIFGGILTICFLLYKAFSNVYKKKIKWMIIYQTPYLKRAFRDNDVEFVMDAIENGASSTEVKKCLFLQMLPENRINEILFIYDLVLKSLKGGVDKNGREYKSGFGEIESKTAGKLTTISAQRKESKRN